VGKGKGYHLLWFGDPVAGFPMGHIRYSTTYEATKEMQVRRSYCPALVVRSFSLHTFKMESVTHFLSARLNH